MGHGPTLRPDVTSARESLFTSRSIPADHPFPFGCQILDACCGGRHWWWNKQHPLALYMDERVEPKGSVDVRPNFEVAPDFISDFREMPFEDESFNLVLFDPPHIVRNNPSDSYIRLKYGALPSDTEQDDLRRGFAECWRVLRPGGTLIFKWAGDLERVKPHFPATPIVGTRSPRGGQTRWFVFYKHVEIAERESEVAA
jgi:SAM-dependent methyltransferase